MQRSLRLLVGFLAALVLAPFVGALPAGAAPGTPNLLSPVGGVTLNANPVFSWDPATNAVNYRIQVANDPSFGGGNVVLDAVTSNVQYTPTADLPQGILYWRVQAYDAVSTPSPFSSVASFTKTAPPGPVLVSPADGATLHYPSDPLTFTWAVATVADPSADAPAGAQSYDIEVDDDPVFTLPLVASASTQVPSYTITNPLATGKTYYWHVRALSANGLATQYSAVFSFTVDWPQVPTLLSPLNQVAPSIRDVEFVWTPVPGAAAYDLQVGQDIDFSGGTVINVTVKSTRYTPVIALPATSYYWRVRGRTSNNVVTAWSTVFVFTKGLPVGVSGPVTLLTPTNNDYAVTDLTFSWTPENRADRYRVQVSTDPTFVNSVFQCDVKHTTYTPYVDCPLGITTGVVYYWRVAPIDDPSNGLGLWSSVWSFAWVGRPAVAAQPSTVQLLSPANNATLANPPAVLSWSDVASSSHYQVKLTWGVNSVLTIDTYNTWAVVTSTVPVGTPITWSVTPYDGPSGGLMAGTPATRTFTVTGSTPVGPATLTATAGALPLRLPLLTWAPTAGATGYTLSYGPPGSGIFNQFATTDLPAFASPVLWTAGTWRIKVSTSVPLGQPVVPDQLLDVVVSSWPVTNLLTPALSCAPSPSCPDFYDTPTFTWDPVLGADNYRLTISYDVDFTNIAGTFVTTESKITPIPTLNDVQAGNAYYWYVQACAGASCSPGGSIYSGQLGSPVGTFGKQSHAVQPIAPGGPTPQATPQQVPDQITFTWTDYLDTNQTVAPTTTQAEKTYHLQVSTVPDFTSLVDDAYVIDIPTYTSSTMLYPEGALYWRVQAIDADDHGLTWSPVWQFEKRSPVITGLTPTGGATVSTTPVLQWGSQDYVGSYNIEVYRNPDQPLAPVNKYLVGSTQNTALVFGQILAPGTYGWRVQRIDVSGNPGPWSATTNAGLALFTVVGTSPTRILPVDNTQAPSNGLLFRWSPVSGAARYRLEVSLSPSFTTFRDSIYTVMSAWAPTTPYTTDATYYWRVWTIDPAGNATAVSTTGVFGRQLAGAPTNVVATAGNASASLTWTAPADNGGSPISGYLITISPGGATVTTVGTSTSKLITGLTNGQSYSFTVAAINGVGTGPASAASNTVTPAAVPDAPTNVVATAGDGQAGLTWTAPASDGGSPITGYQVTVQPSGTVLNLGTGTSTTVTGLTNGTSYTFTVAAQNAIGLGASSVPSNAVIPAGLPSAPSNVVATGGDASAQLTWTAPASDGGSAITGYVITVSPGGATVNVGLVTSTTVNGLTNGTAYTFTVAAVNGVGTGPASAASNSVTPKTTPGAPTGVTGTPGNGSVQLSWTPPASNGGSAITGYQITQQPGGTTYTVGVVTTKLITGLTNGTAYTFTVAAINSVGTGPASAASPSITPRTVPGAPTGVTAVGGNTTAQLSWTAPASNGGSAITGYVITVSPGGAVVNVGNVTSSSVSGLTNGTSYTFTVAAVNAAGTGPASSPSNAVVPAALPGAPTGVSAAAGKQSATVSWTAPASPSGITAYTATASPGGATCTWTTGPLTCVVGGLTAGTSYTFTVTATNGGGTGPASSPSNAVVPWSGAGFHAVTPFRALDSRTAVGGFGGPVAGGTSKVLTVAGLNGVPASASGVVMNVTATGGTSASYLSVYPAGAALPITANLLFAAGQTVPNLVTVGIGSGGQVAFFNQLGSVDVVADVVGYYDDGNGPGDLFHGTTPTRLLDSRGATGGWASTPLGAGQVRDVAVRNRAGVPATATAVVMNVTVTGGTSASYLQAFPSGAAQPVTANLLFAPGQTVPNLVTVGIGANGNVSLFNQLGSVDVVADVVGYYDPSAGGSRFHAVVPVRLLDSRTATGGFNGPVGANSAKSLAVGGQQGIPANATGVVMNVTATSGSAASYLSVNPKPGAIPAPTANLLFAAGQTVPNAVVVGLPANGQVDIYNQLGSVHVVADAAGYFAAT